MIELKHNQIVRGQGFSRYTRKITVGTARGYASKYNECPEEFHRSCLERGHNTAYTTQAASIITANYPGKAEAHEREMKEIADAIELQDGQIVIIEGEQFKVRLAGDGYSDPIHFKRI